MIEKVRTNLNASDIFTKPLAATAFLRHRATIMGPQDVAEAASLTEVKP